MFNKLADYCFAYVDWCRAHALMVNGIVFVALWCYGLNQGWV